jgi:ATP synthase protein I
MKQQKSRSLLLVGVGSMLTSMVVAGFLLGYALDAWVGTKPIFMLLFGGLGLVGGLIKVYKLLIHPDLN